MMGKVKESLAESSNPGWLSSQSGKLANSSVQPDAALVTIQADDCVPTRLQCLPTVLDPTGNRKEEEEEEEADLNEKERASERWWRVRLSSSDSSINPTVDGQHIPPYVWPSLRVVPHSPSCRATGRSTQALHLYCTDKSQ